jgi:hypothetical protein
MKDTAPTDIEKSSIEESGSSSSQSADEKKLVGSWTRTDSPYQIKVSEVLSNGNLTAEYFNPRSINIGIATWTLKEGTLNVYIEFRDDNYPGSIYRLVYNPERDMLIGTYFQAVAGETYDVGFVRSN